MKKVAGNLTVHNRNRLANTKRVGVGGIPLANRTPQRAQRRTVWTLLLLLAVLFLSPGCSVLYLVKRTLKYEPRDFDLTLDEAAACKQYAIWADEAWGSFLDTAPEVSISPSFERGFRDGFVDFVFAGGSGDAPPIPPRRFWRTMYRNPAGDQSIGDWTEGFRAGATVARDGGYRARALVPSLNRRHIGYSIRPGRQSTTWQPEEDVSDGPRVDQAIPAPMDLTPDGLLEAPIEAPISGDASSDDRSGDAAATQSTTRPDSYLTSPTESDLGIGDPEPQAASESQADDLPIRAARDRDTQDENDHSRHQLPSTDPFEDDPLDALPQIEPADPAPPSRPDSLPGRTGPNENLFEDLFGDPVGPPGKEAYRRQAIPSDRVIQNQVPTSDPQSKDWVAQVETSLAQAAAASSKRDTPAPVAALPSQRSLQRHDWFIEGLPNSRNRNNPYPRLASRLQTATTGPSLPEPTDVDRIADQLVGNLRKGNAFGEAQVPATATDELAPLVSASDVSRTASGDDAVSNPTGTPVSPPNTRVVDLIPETVSPTGTDDSAAENALVAYDAPRTNEATFSLSDSFEQDPISIETLDTVDDDVASSVSVFSMPRDSRQPHANDVELNFDRDSDKRTSSASVLSNSSVTLLPASLVDGSPTRFHETPAPPVQQPTKMQFRSASTARRATKPVRTNASRGESADDINATERALQNRNAFRGPREFETNYQRYNGFFQPN